MEEAPEDFVGPLLRDSPEATPIVTSPGLDESQASLDVQPLRSRMVPPPSRAVVPKPSMGKSSKEPPTLDELIPFAWLVLTVFQVACLASGVVPKIPLFSVMYNVIHKSPLAYFQVASPSYNFLYSKKVDKVEPSRWFKLWFLAKKGFSSEVRSHWSLSVASTLSAEDFAKTQAEIEKLRTDFPHALPHEVFCDEGVLIKSGASQGVDLLSLKYSSESCTMPHKVSYKTMTTGKDHLARVSKRKGVASSGDTSDASTLAPAPKKS
ncbi:hypothetical protein LIER_31996 [Lithospermum erythrorhizon]|uniref:Uncharacterized protein n=1 Tax=Lithospermum erythrorhizon TaxID=34254 RepID=A0AAV3RSQ6_LITER